MQLQSARKETLHASVRSHSRTWLEVEGESYGNDWVFCSHFVSILDAKSCNDGGHTRET